MFDPKEAIAAILNTIYILAPILPVPPPENAPWTATFPFVESS